MKLNALACCFGRLNPVDEQHTQRARDSGAGEAPLLESLDPASPGLAKRDKPWELNLSEALPPEFFNRDFPAAILTVDSLACAREPDDDTFAALLQCVYINQAARTILDVASPDDYRQLIFEDLTLNEQNLLLEVRDTLLSLGNGTCIHTPLLAVTRAAAGAHRAPVPLEQRAWATGLANARGSLLRAIPASAGAESFVLNGCYSGGLASSDRLRRPTASPPSLHHADLGLEGLRLHPCWLHESGPTATATTSNAGHQPAGSSGSRSPRPGVVLWHCQPLSWRHGRALALRTMGLLSHLDAAVTLVSSSGRVLFQNAPSRRYYGRLLDMEQLEDRGVAGGPGGAGQANGGAAEGGVAGIRAAGEGARAPAGAALRRADGSASVLRLLHDTQLMQRLFSCDLNHLVDDMLAAWAAGRKWKRLLHVPPAAGLYGSLTLPLLPPHAQPPTAVAVLQPSTPPMAPLGQPRQSLAGSTRAASQQAAPAPQGFVSGRFPEGAGTRELGSVSRAGAAALDTAGSAGRAAVTRALSSMLYSSGDFVPENPAAAPEQDATLDIQAAGGSPGAHDAPGQHPQQTPPSPPPPMLLLLLGPAPHPAAGQPSRGAQSLLSPLFTGPDTQHLNSSQMTSLASGSALDPPGRLPRAGGGPAGPAAGPGAALGPSPLNSQLHFTASSGMLPSGAGRSGSCRVIQGLALASGPEADGGQPGAACHAPPRAALPSDLLLGDMDGLPLELLCEDGAQRADDSSRPSDAIAGGGAAAGVGAGQEAAQGAGAAGCRLGTDAAAATVTAGGGVTGLRGPAGLLARVTAELDSLVARSQSVDLAPMRLHRLARDRRGTPVEVPSGGGGGGGTGGADTAGSVDSAGAWGISSGPGGQPVGGGGGAGVDRTAYKGPRRAFTRYAIHERAQPLQYAPEPEPGARSAYLTAREDWSQHQVDKQAQSFSASGTWGQRRRYTTEHRTVGSGSGMASMPPASSLPHSRGSYLQQRQQEEEEDPLQLSAWRAAMKVSISRRVLDGAAPPKVPASLSGLASNPSNRLNSLHSRALAGSGSAVSVDISTSHVPSAPDAVGRVGSGVMAFLQDAPADAAAGAPGAFQRSVVGARGSVEGADSAAGGGSITLALDDSGFHSLTGLCSGVGSPRLGPAASACVGGGGGAAAQRPPRRSSMEAAIALAASASSRPGRSLTAGGMLGPAGRKSLHHTSTDLGRQSSTTTAATEVSTSRRAAGTVYAIGSGSVGYMPGIREASRSLGGLVSSSGRVPDAAAAAASPATHAILLAGLSEHAASTASSPGMQSRSGCGGGNPAAGTGGSSTPAAAGLACGAPAAAKRAAAAAANARASAGGHPLSPVSTAGAAVTAAGNPPLHPYDSLEVSYVGSNGVRTSLLAGLRAAFAECGSRHQPDEEEDPWVDGKTTMTEESVVDRTASAADIAAARASSGGTGGGVGGGTTGGGTTGGGGGGGGSPRAWAGGSFSMNRSQRKIRPGGAVSTRTPSCSLLAAAALRSASQSNDEPSVRSVPGGTSRLTDGVAMVQPVAPGGFTQCPTSDAMAFRATNSGGGTGDCYCGGGRGSGGGDAGGCDEAEYAFIQAATSGSLAPPAVLEPRIAQLLDVGGVPLMGAAVNQRGPGTQPPPPPGAAAATTADLGGIRRPPALPLQLPFRNLALVVQPAPASGSNQRALSRVVEEVHEDFCGGASGHITGAGGRVSVGGGASGHIGGGASGSIAVGGGRVSIGGAASGVASALVSGGNGGVGGASGQQRPAARGSLGGDQRQVMAPGSQPVPRAEAGCEAFDEADLRWHEVSASPFKDPLTGERMLLLVQTDVTARVEAERKLVELTAAQTCMLEQMFPRHVLEFIVRQGEAVGGMDFSAHVGAFATSHDIVTVLFTDIVGFTTMSKQVPAAAVMGFLSELYSRLDALVDEYGVWKVETAGDCYIVAAGVVRADADGFHSVIKAERSPPASASAAAAAAAGSTAAGQAARQLLASNQHGWTGQGHEQPHLRQQPQGQPQQQNDTLQHEPQSAGAPSGDTVPINRGHIPEQAADPASATTAAAATAAAMLDPGQPPERPRPPQGVRTVDPKEIAAAAAAAAAAAGGMSSSPSGREEDGDPDTHRARRDAESVFGFALAMLRAARGVRMPHDGQPVQLRVGIHSGPLVSGVIGTKMPKFALFGDTMNTASRMESTCRPGCIQVSAATRVLLPHLPLVPTGGVHVKGKGVMETYIFDPSPQPNTTTIANK